MVGDNTLVTIPVNCVSSLLSGKCRICHASTGMTNNSGIQARGHITQSDGGFDNDGYPYCVFSYPCTVCGESVEVTFSGNPDYRATFTDRCGRTIIPVLPVPSRMMAKYKSEQIYKPDLAGV